MSDDLRRRVNRIHARWLYSGVLVGSLLTLSVLSVLGAL